MTAPPAVATFQPTPAAPSKFKREAGESVRMKGNLNLIEGEVGVKNLLTGKCRLTECTVFLTDRRFVATRARRYFPFGPLIWLIRAFFARRIVFSVPLSQVAAIGLDPARRNQLVLQTTAGSEFKLTCNAFISRQPKWVAALTKAVTEFASGAAAEQSETAITFMRR